MPVLCARRRFGWRLTSSSHRLSSFTRNRCVDHGDVQLLRENLDACPLYRVLCTERLDINDPAEAQLSRGRIVQQTTVSTSFPSVSAVASRISVIEVHH
jgi:hypothetical protein